MGRGIDKYDIAKEFTKDEICDDISRTGRSAPGDGKRHLRPLRLGEEDL